jgi:hypothetical protein
VVAAGVVCTLTGVSGSTAVPVAVDVWCVAVV